GDSLHACLRIQCQLVAAVSSRRCMAICLGAYLVLCSLYCSAFCWLPLVFVFLIVCWSFFLFFFFQAEDGIRDATVTGVQTCALPIYEVRSGGDVLEPEGLELVVEELAAGVDQPDALEDVRLVVERRQGRRLRERVQIGRASCRERVEVWVVGRAWKKATSKDDRGRAT